jgi:uncharacterized protein (DUF2147 family)
MEGIMMAVELRSKLIRTIVLLVSWAGSATIASAADPYGIWMRPSTGTQVNFYDCGGKLCGKIVAVRDQSRKSEVGTVIMTGAAKSADNQWKGDLLDTDNGKTYAGVATLRGPNALRLEGCVAFICQGETWSKVR